MIRLGEICTKGTSSIAQKDLESRNGVYPIYGASGFIKNVDFYQQEKPCIAVVKDGAGVGRVMKLPEKSSVIGTMQYIIPNEGINVSYLAYALEYMNLAKYYLGAAIPHIYFKDYCTEELPEHTYEEQCMIAETLDKISKLIALRKEQLAKLDQLVKSRFIELFGDPERNIHGWDTITIGKVIKSCEAGWSANGTQREKKPGEIAVLKVSAVTKGVFAPEECKVLDNQGEIKKYVFPQKGDLLFSRANTREMVGATAVIMQDYPELILPDKLWRIRFVSSTNVLYMKYILSHESIRKKFSAVSTGTSGSMFNVSMEKFRSIVIPLPPLALQNQFATFVEQVDKQKLTIRASLDKLELLKKSLMQEFFG